MVNTHFDSHFQKTIITIHPGEYYSSFDDIYIATVLGSCISIALFDPTLKLGGLNHFMLPSSSEHLEKKDEGRFGNYAVELLMNDLLKKGAEKKHFQAKVFGGGNVLEGDTSFTCQTGLNNINFALQFLETEHIPIIANDTGGVYPRKIFFNPQTSHVYLKRIHKTNVSIEQIKKTEEAYKNLLMENQKQASNIIWF